MKKLIPSVMLTSLLFLAMPILAQSNTSAPKASEAATSGASQYLKMNDQARASFISNYAGNLGWMLSPEKPLVVSAEGVQLIKKWVDVYAVRVGAADPKSGGEDLNKVFERAVQYAPIINGEFEKEKVLETLGNAVALLESEFQPCPAKGKGKGMFAILPASATSLGVKADALCDVEKGANAAARFIKARMAEFGKDGISAALAMLAYNRGTANVKRDFAELIKEHDSGGELWAILAKPDAKKFDKAFLDEVVHYLPRFFAAAILAESPETFGLKAYPLSTYAPPKK